MIATPLFTGHQTIEERFSAFMIECPDVYLKFVRIARQLKARGHKRYSADGICHVIRWHETIRSKARDGFKLNNDFVRCLSRKAMAECPDLEGFFERRQLKTP